AGRGVQVVVLAVAAEGAVAVALIYEPPQDRYVPVWRDCREAERTLRHAQRLTQHLGAVRGDVGPSPGGVVWVAVAHVGFLSLWGTTTMYPRCLTRMGYNTPPPPPPRCTPETDPKPPPTTGLPTDTPALVCIRFV